MIPDVTDPQQIILTLITERDELKGHCRQLKETVDQIGYPPGHFYSPLVDVHDPGVIQAAANRLSLPLPQGIDLGAVQMSDMLRRLAAHHAAFPFPATPEPGLRFHFENPFFACHDAFVLFAMICEVKPRRIVEIGSGFSFRLILDTNEKFFGNAMNLTLIDPHLEQYLPGFGSVPRDVTLLTQTLQQTSLEPFERLQDGDILLIDSSHVAKTGSDVNHYLFEILPRLKPGVIVHIHDILYPFEYPPEWVLNERRNWNEAYAVRAFLQFNSAFSVLYWNNFIFHKMGPLLKRLAPLCMGNEGGSLWLRRN